MAFNTPPAVIRTYSLTLEHIAKVSDLAQRLGISQGEVVRTAIDMLWDKRQAEEEAAQVSA